MSGHLFARIEPLLLTESASAFLDIFPGMGVVGTAVVIDAKAARRTMRVGHFIAGVGMIANQQKKGKLGVPGLYIRYFRSMYKVILMYPLPARLSSRT